MTGATARGLTVAVDGPASSGKGTVARGVARHYGYQYVDTGAMYRSVALVASRRGVAWDDERALAGCPSGSPGVDRPCRSRWTVST